MMKLKSSRKSSLRFACVLGLIAQPAFAAEPATPEPKPLVVSQAEMSANLRAAAAIRSLGRSDVEYVVGDAYVKETAKLGIPDKLPKPPFAPKDGRDVYLWLSSLQRPILNVFGDAIPAAKHYSPERLLQSGIVLPDIPDGIRSKFPNIIQVTRATGKILKKTDSVGTGPLGTVFLVDEKTVMTSAHVVEDLKKAHIDIQKHCQIIFEGHQGAPSADIVGISVLRPSPHDFCLLTIRSTDTLPAPIGHLRDSSPISPNTRVVAVGFPNLTLNNTPDPTYFSQVEQIFRANLKQLSVSPGLITETRLIGGQQPFRNHDCTTFNGNSGGAIVSLESGNIIGIVAGNLPETGPLPSEAKYMNAFSAFSDWQKSELADAGVARTE